MPSTVGELEIAFLAGIYEGEGSIYLNQGYWRVGVEMHERDIEILERLQVAFGGKIYPRSNRTTAQWVLQAMADVLAFCEAVVPFVGGRRRSKLMEAYEHLTERLAA